MLGPDEEPNKSRNDDKWINDFMETERASKIIFLDKLCNNIISDTNQT